MGRSLTDQTGDGIGQFVYGKPMRWRTQMILAAFAMCVARMLLLPFI
jgi:hypothetical protein